MEQKDDDLIVDGVKRIKQLILDKNLKTIDLVDALEISKKNVTQWLQSSTTPNTQNLMELARLLSVAERWISEDKSVNKTNVDKAAKKAAKHAESLRAKSSPELALSQATMAQLLSEIKARYADLNLDADINIRVEPMSGGFVSKE